VVVVVVACPVAVVDVVVPVEAVVVVDDVVVDVAGAPLGATDTPPVSFPDPTTDDSGSPATSSMTVRVARATTKTTPVDTSRTGHRMFQRPCTRAWATFGGAGGTGRVDGTGWVDDTGRVGSDTPAEAGTPDSVGADADADARRPPAADDCRVAGSAVLSASPTASVVPDASVVPNRRRRGFSEATTTCWTAWWPRSMDWATRVVRVVAMMLPMATPMTVPVTPKKEAMTAAATAPVAEARICRTLTFTGP